MEITMSNREEAERIARGKRLREIREKTGLRAATVANLAGISYQQLLEAEDGYRNLAHVQFTRLGETYGCSVAELKGTAEADALLPHVKVIAAKMNDLDPRDLHFIEVWIDRLIELRKDRSR